MKAKTVCLLNVSEDEQFVCEETCLGAISEVKVLSDEAGSETREGKSDDNEAVSDLIAKLPEELTAQQRQAGASLLRRFGDIMSCNEYDIGCTPLMFDTGEHRQIRQPLRRQPLAHQEIIDKQVEEMRRHGIIEPASSPWASNVVLVRKRDGSLRFCVDYRAVNNVTYQDTYLLPRIDSCLDALHGAKWFKILDLRSGYYNIPLSLPDRDKTAFVTRRGCWRFTVMPFGLTCAPGVFQRLMDMMLAGLSYETCQVYLDDVIVCGSTFEELLHSTEVVFQRIRDAKLKLKLSKLTSSDGKCRFLALSFLQLESRHNQKK